MDVKYVTWNVCWACFVQIRLVLNINTENWPADCRGFTFHFFFHFSLFFRSFRSRWKMCLFRGTPAEALTLFITTCWRFQFWRLHRCGRRRSRLLFNFWFWHIDECVGCVRRKKSHANVYYNYTMVLCSFCVALASSSCYSHSCCFCCFCPAWNSMLMLIHIPWLVQFRRMRRRKR